MADQVFISYRRTDAQGSAGRLYDALRARFPKRSLFLDVDAIPPGDDFVETLRAKIAESAVVLVVIGPRWLDAAGSDGARRLDDPQDNVRVEIAEALDQGVRIVPVLVDGAEMPTEAALPAPLKPLTRRNAVTLTHARFGRDVEELITTLAAPARAPTAGASPGRAERAWPWRSRGGYLAMLLTGFTAVGVYGLWINATLTDGAEQFRALMAGLGFVVMPISIVIFALRLGAVFRSVFWRLPLLAPPLVFTAFAIAYAQDPSNFDRDDRMSLLVGSAFATLLVALLGLVFGRRRDLDAPTADPRAPRR